MDACGRGPSERAAGRTFAPTVRLGAQWAGRQRSGNKLAQGWVKRIRLNFWRTDG